MAHRGGQTAEDWYPRGDNRTDSLYGVMREEKAKPNPLSSLLSTSTFAVMEGFRVDSLSAQPVTGETLVYERCRLCLSKGQGHESVGKRKRDGLSRWQRCCEVVSKIVVDDKLDSSRCP